MNQFYRKPAIKQSWLRVLIFMICWIFIAGFIDFVGLGAVMDLFPNLDQRSTPFNTLSRSVTLVFSLLLIFIFRKFIDHRPFLTDWFKGTKRSLDFVVGILGGGLLIAIGAFIVGKLGYIEFSPGSLSIKEMSQYFVFFLVAAALEEVVFRGYVLDNFMEDMPKPVALIISSLLFMLLHISNPNLEPIAYINLFLAGIMLGASYIYTRNLWFPLGLHLGWNFFQAPIFGFEVSGLTTESLFNQEMINENIWTGGKFGFEGSILATILICLATAIIIIQFRKFERNENS